MENERWLKHIRKLAKSNADLHVEVRKLRMQVTALTDDNEHYKREFASQNARILTMAIEREATDERGCPCPFDCDGCHDGDGVCWRGNPDLDDEEVPVPIPKREVKRCRCGDFAGPNGTCNWGDSGCYNCPA